MQKVAQNICSCGEVIVVKMSCGSVLEKQASLRSLYIVQNRPVWVVWTMRVISTPLGFVLFHLSMFRMGR